VKRDETQEKTVANFDFFPIAYDSGQFNILIYEQRSDIIFRTRSPECGHGQGFSRKLPSGKSTVR